MVSVNWKLSINFSSLPFIHHPPPSLPSLHHPLSFPPSSPSPFSLPLLFLPPLFPSLPYSLAPTQLSLFLVFSSSACCNFSPAPPSLPNSFTTAFVLSSSWGQSSGCGTEGERAIRSGEREGEKQWEGGKRRWGEQERRLKDPAHSYAVSFWKCAPPFCTLLWGKLGKEHFSNIQLVLRKCPQFGSFAERVLWKISGACG